MFGLTIREKTMRFVQQICLEEVSAYQRELKHEVGKIIPPGLNEELSSDVQRKIEDASDLARANYFTRIFNRSLAIIDDCKTAGVQERFVKLLAAYTKDTGMPATMHYAGTIYYLIYFAMSGKEAEPKDCIALNHYQANLMDAAAERALSS